jgi:uncharacterized membrane protein
MEQQPRKSAFSYYFRMLLGIGYLVIGIIFLTTDVGFKLMNNKYFGYAFGTACLVYGAFRMYRAAKNWDSPN